MIWQMLPNIISTTDKMFNMSFCNNGKVYQVVDIYMIATCVATTIEITTTIEIIISIVVENKFQT